jgi:hypothetical protein
MPEVHVPQLDDHDEEHAPAAAPPASRGRGRSLVRIALEVALIGTGVFLGLAGEQWRENVHHRELAAGALRRFRTEIQANRLSVANVKDYHAETLKHVQAYVTADPRRRELGTNVRGLQPAAFEHSAWDLALATQALADVDPQLAFALARIYNAQTMYAELTGGILQAMYLRPPSENLEGFLRALEVYYGDIVLIEPQLLRLYDETVPQIDRALGESSARASH